MADYYPIPFPFTINRFSRSMSRTSSVSSKDSLMSSRSNSTNSRSSCCNSCSAKTTISEAASDRKLPLSQGKLTGRSPGRPDLTPHYGSSQRWQFISPIPVAPFKRQAFCRKRAEAAVQRKARSKREAAANDGKKDAAAAGFVGSKFFKLIVSACKECQAIAPSKENSNSRRCENQ